MGMLGTLIYFVGLLGAFIGGVMLLIQAFKHSVLWGFLSLCVPFAGLVFVVMNWSNEQVKKAFFVWLGGFVVMVIGMVLGGGAAMMNRGG